MPQFITMPYIMSTGKLEIMSIHFYIKEYVSVCVCVHAHSIVSDSL